jgi:outer membrane lipoprotein-sorting protein
MVLDMKSYRFFVATTCFLVLGLALTSCNKRFPPPENALESPEQLREAIDVRLEQVETARFREVVLDYFGEKERVKVRQLILVERPDMLRVQTRIPGTDEILSLLVTDGEQFAMHERDSNKYYTGRPTPENINRLLPVDLSATDVVRVMLGGAPWDRFAREPGEPQLEWNTETGRYRYWVETDDGGELSMEVRHTDYAVVEVVEKDASGELVYMFETDDWERTESIALPAYRRFEWPARDLDFSLDVGETQVDVDLPDSLFKLAPPPGSKIIPVDG